MSQPIRLVTFDLYDTLIELTPPRWERLGTALRRLGIEVDPAVLRDTDHIAEDFYTVANAGIPIRDRPAEERDTFRLEYMRVWLEAAGLPADPETVAAARAGYRAELDVHPEGDGIVTGFKVFPEVMSALTRLRRAGIKRAVISNADADVTDFCVRLAFAHEMNLIVTSANVGYEKPDERTYRAALDPLEIDPAEALHIGDQPRSDVVGALKTGMRAALIDRYGRHDAADVGVPVMRSLDELVDFVLAEG